MSRRTTLGGMSMSSVNTRAGSRQSMGPARITGDNLPPKSRASIAIAAPGKGRSSNARKSSAGMPR